MKRSHRFQFTIALLSPSLALSALLVFLFGISLAGAAEPYVPDPGDPIREPWRWRSFDELRGTDTSDIAVGKDGSLWFATREGVTHYDGVRWTSYAKDDLGVEVPVLSVLVARDGSVYAGSEQGISRFKAGKWQRHFPSEGNFYWPVWDLVQGTDGSGGIWISTITESRFGYNGGVMNWRNGGWTRFEPPTSAPWLSYDFAQTSDGILWLSGLRGLHRFDLQTQRSWREVDGAPEALKGNSSRDILSGGDGSLWVGTKASGVRKRQRRAWKVGKATTGDRRWTTKHSNVLTCQRFNVPTRF